MNKLMTYFIMAIIAIPLFLIMLFDRERREPRLITLVWRDDKLHIVNQQYRNELLNFANQIRN